MFMLRGISILCSLIIVPLTINYVSEYEYGIWLTISSLVGWLSFFDLGISNGLRNRFIEAIELGKHKLAQIYVSTAYAIIGIVVTSVWLLAVIATFFIDWCYVLNADPSLSQELMWTVVIVITNFSIQFVLMIVRTLLNAVQRPAIASIFDTVAQAFLLLVIGILVLFTKGSLIKLGLAMGVAWLVVYVIGNIIAFRKYLPQYVPRFSCVRFRFARSIMSLGLIFFFIQIIAISFYHTSNLIISHYVGPSEVTVYNVAFKYMQILTMVFTIMITPFWSAYTEANVKGDYAWMRSTTRKLILMVCALAVLGIVMLLVSPLFYRIWLRGTVEVPFIITFLVYLFHIVNMWGTLWTNLLSGLGKIRLQLICSSCCLVVYLPTGLWACRHFGLVGLLIASVGSMLLCTSWFGIVQVRKLINRTATGIWDK